MAARIPGILRGGSRIALNCTDTKSGHGSAGVRRVSAMASRGLPGADKRQSGIHRIPIPVVHLGPVRNQIGKEAGGGCPTPHATGPSRVGGGSAEVAQARITNLEIGDIADALIRVTDQPQRGVVFGLMDHCAGRSSGFCC